MIKVTIEGLEEGPIILEGKGVVYAVVNDNHIIAGGQGTFTVEKLFNTMVRINEVLINGLKQYEESEVDRYVK